MSHTDFDGTLHNCSVGPTKNFAAFGWCYFSTASEKPPLLFEPLFLFVRTYITFKLQKISRNVANKSFSVSNDPVNRWGKKIQKEQLFYENLVINLHPLFRSFNIFFRGI